MSRRLADRVRVATPCIGLLATLLLASFAARPQGGDPWALMEATVVSHPTLSADGRLAAWVRRKTIGDRIELRVAEPAAFSLDGGQPLPIEDPGMVRSLRWLGDRWLLHVEDGRGGQTLWIGDERSSRRLAAWEGTHRFSVLGQDRRGRLLIAHDRRRAHEPDVYRLDLETGQESLEVRNPGRVFDWLIDGQGEARVARRWRPAGQGVHYEIRLRAQGGNGFRTLIGHDLSAPNLTPLRFTPDNDAIYVERSGPQDRMELFRVDLLSGSLGPPLLDGRAAAVTGLRHDPLDGQLALVTVSGLKTEPVIIDSGWRGAIEALNRDYPEHRLDPIGRDARQRQWWQVTSPASPGHLVWIDDQGQPHRQSALRDITAEQLHPVQPFRFEARDGLPLDGYLTRPNGEGPWPTVLRVHGGPWARDHWQIGEEAQFLAGLGYLVIQVNFRGSRGLGHDRLMAGRGEWGRAMQDDLVDAVDWAVRQGLSDRERVGIMGASYGGYAALMAVLRDPELFRCAVAHAPVTDLAAQIEGYRRGGNTRAWHEWRLMVGDPTSTGARRLLSPLQWAESLNRPVMLSHGSDDRDVDPQHSRRFADRAPAVHWLPFPGEGHRLVGESARRRYYQALAAFLGEHLAGADLPPSSSPAG